MAEKVDSPAPKDQSKKEIPVTPIPAVTPPPAVEPPPPATQPPKQFFDDFSTDKKGFNKLLLIPLCLILVVAAYLLKPTIESFFKGPPPPEIYTPVSSDPKSMHLEINNPDDQILVSQKTVVVSGKTSPKAGIIINIQYPNSTAKEENVGVEASAQGDFQRTINLQPGINQITINAFDSQGNNKIDSREIFYSEEKI